MLCFSGDISASSQYEIKVCIINCTCVVNCKLAICFEAIEGRDPHFFCVYFDAVIKRIASVVMLILQAFTIVNQNRGNFVHCERDQTVEHYSRGPT